MPNCGACGTINSADSQFCKHCGGALSLETAQSDGISTNCGVCGTPNLTDSRFCKKCGGALHLEMGRSATTSIGANLHTPYQDKIVQIIANLGGHNCGRCGYRTCSECAAAILRGEAPPNACVQNGEVAAGRIRQIVGTGVVQLSPRLLGQLLWEGLTSLRLAIALILLLVGLSIVGTLIPQNKDWLFYLDRYGTTGSNIIGFFQIDQLFHTWYFLTLLAFLAINTLSCAIKRFRVSWQIVRRPAEARSAEEIADLPGFVKLPWQGASIPALESILTRRQYRLKQSSTQMWASKNIPGRLGVDLLHVSLIVILIGGLVGGLGGFEDFQVAHKGETFKVAKGGFDVRIDDLSTSSYKDSSQIKDYFTKLTILEGGHEVATKTIEVNSPITHNGISLYQASFGSDWMGKAELTFRVERANIPAVSAPSTSAQNQTSNPTPPTNPHAALTNPAPTSATPEAPLSIQEITATLGSEFALDDGKRKARVVAFYPDLVMSEQGPVNRSQRLNNPAALLEIYANDKPDKPEYTTWTFAQFPEFQHEFAKGNPYRFFLSGMKAPEFTGLQIAYNPGIGLIYFGFAMLILGLCLNFYLPPRRIWATIKDNTIYLGGLGRDPREFEPELEEIVEEYNQKIGQKTVPAVKELSLSHP